MTRLLTYDRKSMGAARCKWRHSDGSIAIKPTIAFPPDGKDSGRGRIFFRIGVGQGSWIGSFEIGHMSVSTTFIMPDGKHLFVSAQGAGYIIELKSRRLVEQIGTDVAGISRNAPMTLFLVDHNGMSLEAFGPNGRLWKTDTSSCGGFRDTAFTDTCLIGQVRQAYGWVPFSLDLATGDVHLTLIVAPT